MRPDPLALLTPLERLFVLRAQVTAAIEVELARAWTIGLPDAQPGTIHMKPADERIAS